MTVLNLKDVYPEGVFSPELIKILHKHKTTVQLTNDDHLEHTGYRFKIHNNIDLIHDLIRFGFKDLLSKPTNEFSHILEKDNMMFYVRKHIEAHHFFD